MILLGLGIGIVCTLCVCVMGAIAREANERNRWMHNGRKEDAE